jgi:hypothetical protein
MFVESLLGLAILGAFGKLGLGESNAIVASLA